MPRAGAIVMAIGSSPEAVGAVRGRLVAALKQGALWRLGGVSLGSGDCPDAPRRKLLSRGRISDIGDMVAAFLVPLVVVAVILTLGYQECPKGEDCNPLTVNVSSAVWPWVLAVGIGLVLAVVRWFNPQLNPLLRVIAPVEIADTSLARKAVPLLWTGVVWVGLPGALLAYIVGPAT